MYTIHYSGDVSELERGSEVQIHFPRHKAWATIVLDSFVNRQDVRYEFTAHCVNKRTFRFNGYFTNDGRGTINSPVKVIIDGDSASIHPLS